MDIFTFMNSKTLFKDVRHRPADQQPPKPAMVHISGWSRRLVAGLVGWVGWG